MTLVLRDELAAAAAAASPTSDLVARSRQAGRRRLARRRRRAVAGVGAGLAAVVLGSTVLPTWWVRSEQSVGAAGTSPSAPASPGPSRRSATAAAVTGTAADWLAALERSMPYVDQLEAVSAATDGPADLARSTSVQAVFRGRSDGRTTSLVVTVFGRGTQTPAGRAVQTALASCGGPGAVTCEPVRQTVTGPVLIRHAGDRGVVDALSFRASGVVVVVRIPERSTTTGTSRAGHSPAAFTLDQLADIAALLPEPELAGGSGAASGATASAS